MGRFFVLAFFLFILGVFPHRGLGADQEIALEFEGNSVSARLDKVPLRSVLEKISAEKGIRFEGGESLMSKDVSANFTRLPLEEALKRVLEGTSYVFIYGHDRHVSKVTLMGPSGGGKGQAVSPPAGKGGRGVAPAQSMKGLGAAGPVGKPAEPIGDDDSEGIAAIQGGEEEIPGGPVRITAEEREIFQVIENVPSPGGPVEEGPVDSPDFKIIRNVPPPGRDVMDAGPPGVP